MQLSKGAATAPGDPAAALILLHKYSERKSAEWKL